MWLSYEVDPKWTASAEKILQQKIQCDNELNHEEFNRVGIQEKSYNATQADDYRSVSQAIAKDKLASDSHNLEQRCTANSRVTPQASETNVYCSTSLKEHDESNSVSSDDFLAQLEQEAKELELRFKEDRGSRDQQEIVSADNKDDNGDDAAALDLKFDEDTILAIRLSQQTMNHTLNSDSDESVKLAIALSLQQPVTSSFDETNQMITKSCRSERSYNASKSASLPRQALDSSMCYARNEGNGGLDNERSPSPHTVPHPHNETDDSDHRKVNIAGEMVRVEKDLERYWRQAVSCMDTKGVTLIPQRLRHLSDEEGKAWLFVSKMLEQHGVQVTEEVEDPVDLILQESDYRNVRSATLRVFDMMDQAGLASAFLTHEQEHTAEWLQARATKREKRRNDRKLKQKTAELSKGKSKAVNSEIPKKISKILQQYPNALKHTLFVDPCGRNNLELNPDAERSVRISIEDYNDLLLQDFRVASLDLLGSSSDAAPSRWHATAYLERAE